MRIDSAKDLEVYKRAYALSMERYLESKNFPQDERYALSDQIRRSSRSVAMNLRETWAKRRYEAHFISKLTDCDGENAETETSLDFAKDCGYLTPDIHADFVGRNREIGRMLGAMISNPKPFLLSSDLRPPTSDL
jgi:four helix bundle protein